MSTINTTTDSQESRVMLLAGLAFSQSACIKSCSDNSQKFIFLSLEQKSNE